MSYAKRDVSDGLPATQWRDTMIDVATGNGSCLRWECVNGQARKAIAERVTRSATAAAYLSRRRVRYAHPGYGCSQLGGGLPPIHPAGAGHAGGSTQCRAVLVLESRMREQPLTLKEVIGGGTTSVCRGSLIAQEGSKTRMRAGFGMPRTGPEGTEIH